MYSRSGQGEDRSEPAYYHYEFLARLDALKDAYNPFDPDRDTKVLNDPSETERQKRLDSLFANFDDLLKRANYHHMSKMEIEEATRIVSAWGINLDVDFDCFER